MSAFGGWVRVDDDRKYFSVTHLDYSEIGRGTKLCSEHAPGGIGWAIEIKMPDARNLVTWIFALNLNDSSPSPVPGFFRSYWHQQTYLTPSESQQEEKR